MRLRTSINTVGHRSQPYDTCGDWQFFDSPQDNTVLYVMVSELGDWRYEALIAVHEWCEALLCRNDGVTAEQVTVFDLVFEAAREAGNDDCFLFRGKTYPIDYEPGDCSEAPYHKQHCVATAVERLMCFALGCSWAEYEKRVLALVWKKQGA